jgi:hypothetical protein
MSLRTVKRKVQMRLQLAQDLAMLGQNVERLAGQDFGRA